MTTLTEARNKVRALEAEARELHAAAVKLKEAKLAEGLTPEQLVLGAQGSDESDPATRAFLEIDAAYRAADAKKHEAMEARERLNKMYEWEGAPATEQFQARRPFGDGGSQISGGLGSRFVESEQYKALLRSGICNSESAFVASVGRFFDIPVGVAGRDEVEAILRGAGYGATTVTGGGATSAGPFIQNDLVPGFVAYLRKRPTLAAMVGQGTTDSDVVEYVTQSAPTNNAAEVAEDAAGTEQTYAFATNTTNVREIAAHVPVTNRAMADAGQIRTIVENELIADVLDRLDTQIASGDGTGVNLTGIYNSGVSTIALGGDTRLDAVHKAITTIRTAAGVLMEPDAIGMHPNDWQDVALDKNLQGEYLLGGPGLMGQKTIWGFPVVVSTVFPSGTPLVGNFARGATLWLRSGVEVSTGLDGNDFTRRRVTILAVMRVAFAVTRPAAFCTITGF